VEHFETGIVVIVGNYGSGKTEVSVNLALNQKDKGRRVRLADLDLVNPYFRSREVRQLLESKGIEVLLPDQQYLQADLPILSPTISGMIRDPGELALLDVGGDDVGATVLAALADAFQEQAARVLQVVNPNRPYTDTIDGCIQIKNEIEKSAKMTITGIVGNANLMDETNASIIYQGYEFVADLAETCRLPLEFITIESRLMDQVDLSKIHCPVLPLERHLTLPWMSASS